ncbi:hypothetical protein [Nitrosomonas ureae]|uniref:Uncharacterized protein n=1 Tax=Nitrosomonas ureae TaxID=44577 RepID=A0A1H5XTV8_9PROT|nr:hypothetical protein [Nitrosomonas ureae]SEG15229.1 hypothetical protein SAMN05216334_1324 [Nitrosomonas ureae]
MAKMNDGLESSIDESLIFFDHEKLRDTSQLIKYECLTIAQCICLLLLYIRPEKDQDVTEELSTYTMLAFNDIKLGKLQALHPKTLLSWAQYLEMIKSGLYGNAEDLSFPMVTAGWLVKLEDCEKWYRSKNLSIDLSEVKADIEKLNKAQEISIDQETITSDYDIEEQLAILFDPVPVEALEKMFPANDKWKYWADKAKITGLICARKTRAKFNPYQAGMWFIRKGMEGWDEARLYRTLANNLPARSRASKHLLTGDID